MLYEVITVLEKFPPVPVQLPFGNGEGEQVLERHLVIDPGVPEGDLLGEHPLVDGNVTEPGRRADHQMLRHPDLPPLEERGPRLHRGVRGEPADLEQLERTVQPLPLEGRGHVPGGRAGDDHREMAGLDVGAKDGKDRPLGNVLKFNRILEVVEEKNGVQQVPPRREREGEGVRKGGKTVPFLSYNFV